MGWTPETFWGSTLHEFYRFAAAWKAKTESDDRTTRARMAWLMWAAGVQWKEDVTVQKILDWMTPQEEPSEESPVVKFKREWLKQRGLTSDDTWLQ